MVNTVVAHAIEDLKPYLNNKSVLEIVVRGKNKRIRAFQKVALGNLPQAKEKQIMQNVFSSLNKNNLLNQKNAKMLGNISRLQNIGLLLNGLNLCASCAGFAIMFEKLEAISAEINRQFAEVEDTIKKGHDIQSNLELNFVLSEHRNMLDSIRKKQPYSEEKLRELVDKEYNVLLMLIEIFQKGTSADQTTTIFSIFSLLSMFTVAICNLDETYYFNNREVLGDGKAWHSSHSTWMGIYDTLSSDWIIEKLQDQGLLEMKLNTAETDAYYISLVDQVLDQRQEIEDNQELIKSIGSTELLSALRDTENQEAMDEINRAFTEADVSMGNPDLAEVLQQSLEQVGLAF